MHYSDYPSFTSAFIGFSNLGRQNKLNIGILENREALIAAVEGLWVDTNIFRAALKAIYCTNPEEGEIFDSLFDRFWLKQKSTIKGKTSFKNQSNIPKNSKASLVMVGVGLENNDSNEDAHNTSGASINESLKKTDFTKIEQIESTILEELAEELWKQMSIRLKRKLKKSSKGKIDLSGTIRSNLSTGGSMIKLIRKNRLDQKYRLVILLDVSGSMDKYSFYLLKFIVTLKSNFKNVEAFLFSTDLMRVTEYLDKKDLKKTLALMSHHVHNWSSGTKMGSCLKIFNEQFAKRILNGKTMTIILSDGLDTGDTSLLKEEMEKIKLRTKKLIWLNPLKGMQDYQPIQRGMEAALPSLDHFASAHNIESLLKLEEILANA